MQAPVAVRERKERKGLGQSNVAAILPFTASQSTNEPAPPGDLPGLWW
jgi:hypothetical protein